jgi:RNA polymerase sigma-70 factor (ECF subfamily)
MAARLRRPSSNDEERFRSIFESRYSSIHSYVARRLGPSNDDVADVTAQVFHTAWRRRAHLPEAPDDLPWLYGIARKLVHRHWRSTRRRHQLQLRLVDEAHIVPGETSVSLEPEALRVRAAMSRLRDADQEVLKLTHWEQLTRTEAGQVLGCSANAVSIRLHKARQRLRQELDRGPSLPDMRPDSAGGSWSEGPSNG